MTVLPKLTVQNNHQRMTFAEWAQNNKVSLNNVWFGLLWPIFCEETANSERYSSMLRNTFVPHLLATENVASDFLHDISDSCVISHRFPYGFPCGQHWSPNSPHLNPCDYFLWGFLKENILSQKPQTIMELRALTIQAWPVTVAERSKACTVFARSEAGIVGSNPTQGMDVCVRLCLSTGRGLATS
ncbi:hypothetical protein B7P43_G12827 [Cryptotermes secundus]|uniref:Uncharacterized protein n=1 Tax=Cryptotermes secundus TaxID=105785 RepID=A0A2J7PVJ8_9NEOP|nr:hypothetical protein B7P43_G12827 [Cryptotermes secundus]